jgi:hypothetical protein
VPGLDPSLEGEGDEGVFGAVEVGSTSFKEGTTLRSEELLVYTGMCCEWPGEAGLLVQSLSRDTAESVEERRAWDDRPADSLALSTVSGTLPLLPELVSSDSPLSTPLPLKCFLSSSLCSASILGS